MADLLSSTVSETAASNNSASPDGAPEGMAPSGVNDSIRENMAAQKRFANLMSGVYTTGGTANAQTVTMTTVLTALHTGHRVIAKIGAALVNTGATTLQLKDGSTSLTAKSVVLPDGSALVGGELQVGMWAEFLYDGTNYVLLNQFQGAGTWTPTLTAGSGSATLTSTALYRRSGRTVHATCKVAVTATTLASATVTLGGLPYTVRNSDGAEGAVTIWYEGIDNAGAGTDIELVGYLVKNTKTIKFDLPRDAATAQQMAGGAITTSTVFRIAATYETTE